MASRASNGSACQRGGAIPDDSQSGTKVWTRPSNWSAVAGEDKQGLVGPVFIPGPSRLLVRRSLALMLRVPCCRVREVGDTADALRGYWRIAVRLKHVSWLWLRLWSITAAGRGGGLGRYLEMGSGPDGAAEGAGALRARGLSALHTTVPVWSGWEQ